MTDPTTTAPALPLGADTIAVMRSNAAKIATWDSERATVLVHGDRPRREVQLALDVQALCDALAAADAAGAERGRAEVNAACGAIWTANHWHLSLSGPWHDGRPGSDEWHLAYGFAEALSATSPVAAILAAAAALAPGGAS